ncbi:sigma-70 family RNA polymerase sigma factor [Bailinhaonella thermotolerans]|uniref:Sigma-70 family RNA polymerase sigma factor n=1 Tax=Bailinhaonella thermotolerans TaxID=1070861 RepID=A0A3A4B1U0_9ACTN|nr:sigma-70 family RNA polymerase sigma factor [Bailinhaonella thermotolerans]RJL31987.1 sigma-70 family RNA polymerase sigma factor [Bailinhaonella thermotolerans]
MRKRSSRLADMSDAAVMAVVREGEATAYSALYERHVDAARALARQLVRAEEAEDVVAETFARLLDLLRRGGGPSDGFRPYLLTSMRHVVHDRSRAERGEGSAERPASGDVVVLGQADPFADPAVRRLERTLIARAYDSLPERWRTVLWHTEVERARPAQLAPLFGLAPNGVAALAYRAREGMRQAYLQMHLAAALGQACRPTIERLGAYVRGGLARRDARTVDEHLDACGTCRDVYLELADMDECLRAVVGPIVAGSALQAYLAALAEPGRGAGAAAAGALDWWLRVPRHRRLTAAGTAVSVAVAGAVALALVSDRAGLPHPPEAEADTRVPAAHPAPQTPDPDPVEHPSPFSPRPRPSPEAPRAVPPPPPEPTPVLPTPIHRAGTVRLSAEAEPVGSLVRARPGLLGVHVANTGDAASTPLTAEIELPEGVDYRRGAAAPPNTGRAPLSSRSTSPIPDLPLLGRDSAGPGHADAEDPWGLGEAEAAARDVLSGDTPEAPEDEAPGRTAWRSDAGPGHGGGHGWAARERSPDDARSRAAGALPARDREPGGATAAAGPGRTAGAPGVVRQSAPVAGVAEGTPAPSALDRPEPPAGAEPASPRLVPGLTPGGTGPAPGGGPAGPAPDGGRTGLVPGVLGRIAGGVPMVDSVTWSCRERGERVRCTRGPLAAGSASSLYLPVVVAEDAPLSRGARVVLRSENGTPVVARGRDGVRANGMSARFAADGRLITRAVGNSLLSCPERAHGCSRNGARRDNDLWEMRPVDLDEDASTGSSSAARVVLPGRRSVRWAGLFWSGSTRVPDIRLRGPRGGYRRVHADAVERGDLPGGPAYQAFADVTALVREKGPGTWWAADAAGRGGTSRYAGWSLVVVAEDAAAPYGRSMVLSGARGVNQRRHRLDVPLGALRPAALPARLSVVAWEGDADLPGDRVLLGGRALRPYTGDRDAGNVFDGSSAGAVRAPLTPGVDVDAFSARLGPDPRLRLTTRRDAYVVGVVALNVPSRA